MFKGLRVFTKFEMVRLTLKINFGFISSCYILGINVVAQKAKLIDFYFSDRQACTCILYVMYIVPTCMYNAERRFFSLHNQNSSEWFSCSNNCHFKFDQIFTTIPNPFA